MVGHRYARTRTRSSALCRSRIDVPLAEILEQHIATEPAGSFWVTERRPRSGCAVGSTVLDWATARGLGPATIRRLETIGKVLPARARSRASCRVALQRPFGLPGCTRRASGRRRQGILFTILTAARRGETLGARWSEINLAQEDVDRAGQPHEERRRACRAVIPAGDQSAHQPAARTRQRLRVHREPIPAAALSRRCHVW